MTDEEIRMRCLELAVRYSGEDAFDVARDYEHWVLTGKTSEEAEGNIAKAGADGAEQSPRAPFEITQWYTMRWPGGGKTEVSAEDLAADGTTWSEVYREAVETGLACAKASIKDDRLVIESKNILARAGGLEPRKTIHRFSPQFVEGKIVDAPGSEGKVIGYDEASDLTAAQVSAILRMSPSRTRREDIKPSHAVNPTAAADVNILHGALVEIDPATEERCGTAKPIMKPVSVVDDEPEGPAAPPATALKATTWT